ncbi:iron complex transport system ATP-binding protein [Aminobacter lissarensis]|uniref:Iron complex transport system ATP-binding protein n=1 Tax=Aminobacter carboxidus TaxID=376165 RepID=A0A8E1WL56_9HYPH|nr:ABC transporter ATP-binding protein [Aminobacter lissarensis]MBB6469391.1 iron complex transport system ATP-binding protein [Aminobacter lissarensis]
MPVSAKDLHVSLAGREIIHGVSVSVKRGHLVGLIGPNGAGKSTLIRALSGLLASRGDLRADGLDVRSLSHDARARTIAYLPQQRVIGWPISVEKAVALGRLPWSAWQGLRDQKSKAICADAMHLMDIAHLAGRRANELSGGEQARVLAARAIAQDTPVLLADEPASGLDPAHQISMMAAFRRIAASGRTVLASLHDLTLAARWCDSVVVLSEGRIAAAGRPADVMTAGILGDVFGISVRVETDACGLILSPLGLLAQGPS